MTDKATHRAAGLAEDAADSPVVQWGARLGFVVSGVVNLLVAWIALRVAWGQGGQASQSGAMATLAGTPGGKAVLWVCVAGGALLALWQLSVAAFGGPKGTVGERLGAIGKAVFYGALAVAAFRFTVNRGQSSSATTKDATATLMGHTGGRWLVALIGVGVVVAAGWFVWRGLSKGFLDDLEKDPGRWLVEIGRVGYVAKGVAYALVGILFVVAAVHRSPGRAAGLDGALHTLRGQPFGQWLLTVVALGLAAFGVYCVARSRYQRM